MRWAGFLRHMEPDMVRRILKGLKLDNETVDKNGKVMAGAAQCASGAGEKAGIRRFLSRTTPDQFDGLSRGLRPWIKTPGRKRSVDFGKEIEKVRGLRILKGVGCWEAETCWQPVWKGRRSERHSGVCWNWCWRTLSLNRRDLLLSEKLRG